MLIIKIADIEYYNIKNDKKNNKIVKIFSDNIKDYE